MTQTIVQGPEDPLLVLDHQGGSGNPTFENAAAFIWWDQVTQVFNMGLASVGAPSLSIVSDGAVFVNALKVNNVADITSLNSQLIKANRVETPALQVNTADMGTASMNGLRVGDVTAEEIVVNQSMLVANANINGLLVQEAATITGGGLVANSANISQLTAGGLVVQQGGTLTGGLAADAANITQLTANALLAGSTRINGGLVVDNVNASGTIIAGSYLTSSSRETKENIVDFGNQEALEALEHLNPVKFNLKADNAKKLHHGFIAEDVPQSVAGSDGKSINVMDIVAILTRVVKEQQKTIDALVAKSQ
jgi:hypothetical protein